MLTTTAPPTTLALTVILQFTLLIVIVYIYTICQQSAITQVRVCTTFVVCFVADYVCLLFFFSLFLSFPLYFIIIP